MVERWGEWRIFSDAADLLENEAERNNQIVFAFGETLAHLHCLETRARVKRIEVDGVHRFVALADLNAQPPADDTDDVVMDIGQT